ncbi:MAG: hypothetical protein D6791_15290 [Chloroflexi bacterium]|nr:MAG: hypothetical protein D6791_15290 [Chloroflexota bacterium]
MQQARTSTALSGETTFSRGTFLHAVALVLGFSAVFILLGASVGLLGNRVLEDVMPLIVRSGAVLLVVFALRVAHINLSYVSWGIAALVVAGLTYLFGSAQFNQANRVIDAVLIGLVVLSGAKWDRLVLLVLAILIGALSWITSTYGFLLTGGSTLPLVLRVIETLLVVAIVYFGNRTDVFEQELRVDMGNKFGDVSYGRSALVGVVFAAGWTPCVGPILASIFLLASQAATVGQGALLLAFYSLGLGIPFLITGALFSKVTAYLPRFYKYLPAISVISAILLIVIALLLFTGSLARLSQAGFLFEGIYQFEESLVPESASQISLAIAFIAGLISFLSPCVLPLVPAYLGYLSGAAIGGTAAGKTSAA